MTSPFTKATEHIISTRPLDSKEFEAKVCFKVRFGALLQELLKLIRRVREAEREAIASTFEVLAEDGDRHDLF